MLRSFLTIGVVCIRLYSSRMCCAVAAFSCIVTAAGVDMAAPGISADTMVVGWAMSLGLEVLKERARSPDEGPAGGVEEDMRSIDSGSLSMPCVHTQRKVFTHYTR